MRSIILVVCFFAGCNQTPVPQVGVITPTGSVRSPSSPIVVQHFKGPKNDLQPDRVFSTKDVRDGCLKDIVIKPDEVGQVRHQPEPSCYGQIDADAAGDITVNVIFIRHAQSVWNKAYEDVHHAFIPMDPHLTDAHLSELGIDQSVTLAEAIEAGNLAHISEEDKKILLGEPVEGRKSVYASSNLRRATLTLLIALRRLFLNPRPQGPKIHVLSSLQERGAIDAQSLTNPREIPFLNFKDKCPFRHDDIFDTKCNDGNEMRRKKNEQNLQANTCLWIRRKAAIEGITDFVLVGHSNWLGSFFQAFSKNVLDPSDPAHKLSVPIKLSNAGMIKFQFSTRAAPGHCRIVDKSTVVAFGDINSGN